VRRARRKFLRPRPDDRDPHKHRPIVIHPVLCQVVWLVHLTCRSHEAKPNFQSDRGCCRVQCSLPDAPALSRSPVLHASGSHGPSLRQFTTTHSVPQQHPHDDCRQSRRDPKCTAGREWRFEAAWRVGDEFFCSATVMVNGRAQAQRHIHRAKFRNICRRYSFSDKMLHLEHNNSRIIFWTHGPPCLSHWR
jgi:hypothetical protein